MSKPKQYFAKSDGWIAGAYRRQGEPIELTEVQAKYESVTTEDPNAPNVEPAPKAKAASPTRSKRRK